MGNTVEWSDFVSFRNIFLTHNFCIIIIIIGHLQNFALLILVAILPAASFQVAKLLRTVDPLLHIGSISVPLPSSSSSFQDVRRLKANFYSWPTVGPHLGNRVDLFSMIGCSYKCHCNHYSQAEKGNFNSSPTPILASQGLPSFPHDTTI